MNSIAARKRQNGMTYLGMLIMLIVIAFFAIVLIKVAPLYMEDLKVKSSLDSLAQEAKDSQSTLTSASEIMKQLFNRLGINDVTHVARENVKITNEGHKTVITVDYEARVHLFYNIDVVARFPDNRVELGGP
jgi:type II secretory pathway pseudopilin PulG